MKKDSKSSRSLSYDDSRSFNILTHNQINQHKDIQRQDFVYDTIHFEQPVSPYKILNSEFKRTPSYGTADDDELAKNLSFSDIIGNFGLFQLIVLLFSGLREASVGYDAVVMSIILQPEQVFSCADPIQPQIQNNSLKAYTSLPNDTTIDKQCSTTCNSWVFPSHRYGSSLVADWQLVCQRHWLIAFTESAYFLGLVMGNLIWGYYADKIGRRRTYLYSHTVALLSGCASLFMPNVFLFSLSRFLSAFGLIGYNIIYSIQVELIGTKYRAFSTVMNHLGWGLGVISVPIISHLFTDYRFIIAIAPLLSIIMYPWAFWIPESSRWLMINGEFAKANKELTRIAKFNGKLVTPVMEKKLYLLRRKVMTDKLNQEASGAIAKHSYQMILSSRVLLSDTLILSYISFTGHLFYYLLTINFAYIDNLSIEANFIISGAGEWVSVVVGAILLKFFSRRTCMSLFSAFIGCVFIFQAILDSKVASVLDTPLVVTANNGMGTLSSLLLVFVTLIVNQEVYPTVVRQTGSSLVNTLGESGSTLAPILLYLSRLLGLWKADLLYAIICIVGVVGAQFITKTDNMELMDS